MRVAVLALVPVPHPIPVGRIRLLRYEIPWLESLRLEISWLPLRPQHIITAVLRRQEQAGFLVVCSDDAATDIGDVVVSDVLLVHRECRWRRREVRLHLVVQRVL